MGQTNDTLVNLVSHLGDANDKQAYSQFATVEMRTQLEYEVAYRNWLVAKVVDLIPDEMARRWRELYLEDKDIDEFNDFSDKLDVRGALKTGLKWGRLTGGGGVYMVFEKDTNVSQPLDLDKVSLDNPLVKLLPFDRFDVQTEINLDPSALNYLRPERYRFIDSPNGQWIHWTRVLGPIDGYRLNLRQQKERLGWGGSVVERNRQPILDALAVFSSVASITHKADVDTMGIDGLLTKTANSELMNQMIARFTLLQQLMSNNRILLYDRSVEEIGKHAANLAGLLGLIPEEMSLVASATGIPITQFFGTPPKGLNATGEGDRKQWQATVAANQSSVFGPLLGILDPIIARSVYGSEVKVEYQWTPLEDPSDLDAANAANVRSNTAATYVTMGAIQPSHVSQELLSENEYSALDQEYVDSLKEIEGIKGEMAEEALLNPPEPTDQPEDEDNDRPGQTDAGDSEESEAEGV